MRPFMRVCDLKFHIVASVRMIIIRMFCFNVNKLHVKVFFLSSILAQCFVFCFELVPLDLHAGLSTFARTNGKTCGGKKSAYL